MSTIDYSDKIPNNVNLSEDHIPTLSAMFRKVHCVVDAGGFPGVPDGVAAAGACIAGAAAVYAGVPALAASALVSAAGAGVAGAAARSPAAPSSVTRIASASAMASAAPSASSMAMPGSKTTSSPPSRRTTTPAGAIPRRTAFRIETPREAATLPPGSCGLRMRVTAGSSPKRAV